MEKMEMTLKNYKFTLTTNESESVTHEGQDSFYWYFFDNNNIGYDIIEANNVEEAKQIFVEKYDVHIKEVLDGSHNKLSILNSFDALLVSFDIE